MKLIEWLPLALLVSAFALRFWLAKRAGYPNPYQARHAADASQAPQ